MSHPKKITELLSQVHNCLSEGKFLDTRHAIDRQNERKITRPEVLYVLRNGYHEKAKDKFESQFQSWNYSIKGTTIDQRKLRVIVSFDEEGMLIVTAIELDR